MVEAYEYSPGWITDGRKKWRSLTVRGYQARCVWLLLECTKCGRVKDAPARKLIAMGLGNRPLEEIAPRMRCRGQGKNFCGGTAVFKSGLDTKPPP